MTETKRVDHPSRTAIRMMDEVAGKGGKAWIKWTCPKCGERVTANEPNTFHTRGYAHEAKRDGSPCGAVYTGDMFGLLVAYPVGGWGP